MSSLLRLAWKAGADGASHSATTEEADATYRDALVQVRR